MRHGLGASQLSIVTLSTRDGAQINIGLREEGEQRFSSDAIFSLTQMSMGYFHSSFILQTTASYKQLQSHFDSLTSISSTNTHLYLPGINVS